MVPVAKAEMFRERKLSGLFLNLGSGRCLCKGVDHVANRWAMVKRVAPMKQEQDREHFISMSGKLNILLKGKLIELLPGLRGCFSSSILV